MKAARNRLLVGDVRDLPPTMPAASVDCVTTSPPHYRLRDYGPADQIGLEPDIDGWVSELLDVTREIGRVLKPGGSCWLNVGDTYSKHDREGARSKSLVLAPDGSRSP